MSAQGYENLIEKLVLLEQATGANVHYRVMPPFTTPFYNHLSIQKTAKDIAEFIGLKGFTFIVAVAKQQEKVGAHIDLSSKDNSVFVEVDDATFKFPDAVATTLCHEICHKWLQANRITLPVETENEILTDIACVFLGFGKIMLNGCSTTLVRSEPDGNGTRTITETLTSGYLDRAQLAYVYRVVCAMRNMPEADVWKGLNNSATEAVKACDTSYGHQYDRRLHWPETMQESVDEFGRCITDLQLTLACVNKHAIYTRQSFLQTIDNALQSGHKEIVALQRKAAAMTLNAEADPSLRFLRSTLNHHELARMRAALKHLHDDCDALLEDAQGVGTHISEPWTRFPPPSPGMFNIVTCPNDGTKLRLPESAGNLIAVCPTCKYRFAYNTDPLTFSEPPQGPMHPRHPLRRAH